MARKRKSKGSTQLDWSQADEGGGGFRIPEGDYRMKFESIEMDQSQKGEDVLVWDFKGVEGKAKGKIFRIWTSLQPQALWKLGQLLDALGIERPETAEEVISAVEEAGDDLEIIGEVRDDEYQGKTRSKVDNFLSTEESEDEEEDKKSKKGKKKKEDDEEEDEEEEKKSSKKGGAKKGGKKKKISTEEVQDMDEDELSELNDEHELGLDLDDFKTLRKKAAAVIAALEENDLLED